MKIDLAKRRRIMQRSMQLGHCICDPRRPCPCEVFTDRGFCPCAGERPDPAPAEQVRLTELVHNAGCASKIAPADLERVLSRLPAVDDSAVLSGLPAGDDAGIYRLADGVHLVQTVDVMTPCVDDPHAFGRICAANCLSDIYAMGGVPRTALSILAFPAETLDGEIMYRMMAGAMEVLAEARCALIGGHSIKDDEVKLGFAITGTVESGAAVERGTARAGDVLVLTKPLGTGVLAFCRQIGRRDGLDLAAVERAMATLNRAAAEAMRRVGVSAATDVTGFGLFGHLIGMARNSGVTAEVHADRLPAFGGVLEALRGGVVPGAVERNREYIADDLTVADGVDEALVHLGLDAQTSGGLLIAVPHERLDRLLAELAGGGAPGVVIGQITEKSAGRIHVTLSSRARPTTAPASTKASNAMTSDCCGGNDSQSSPHGEGCCAEAFGAAGGTSSEAAKAFAALTRAVAAGGALDERTKELITFSLVVLSRCGPCVTAHRKKALGLGITPEQLDEAAWCAIAIGGACVKVFYEQTR